jgi:hypothetical protein
MHANTGMKEANGITINQKKRIVKVKRLVKDSKEERLENIYRATIKPIFIPMLQILADGKIIIHLDDESTMKISMK